MGREFALQLDADPENDLEEIWLVARRRDRLMETAALITRAKPRIFTLDLSGNEWSAVLEKALHEQPVEVLFWVNNAGFGTYGTFTDSLLEKQLSMIDVNVRALTQLSYLALPSMKSGSALINVASLAAFFPLGNFAVYAATKAYVLSFSSALAAEVEEKGVLVHSLCPGPVKTEFANVASGGYQKEVHRGQNPEITVRRCLKAVRKKLWQSLPDLGWKLTAWLSRWVHRKTAARFSLKFMPRTSGPK